MIICIGNALVDSLTQITDSKIDDLNLNKARMTLVDKERSNFLLQNMESPIYEAGGSAANTAYWISQLGGEAGFIGKVSDDDFGNKYEEGLKKENVEYFYTKKKEELPTGTCLILVTPDSERTMCTFLGTAGKINENDVSSDVIKKSEIIFLEGYLWDEGEPKKAFDKAINNANKVAMSLSDLFCVDRHKPHFLNLVKNKLDITFANEQEMISLIDAKSIEEVVSFCKEQKKLFVITRGSDGALSIENNNIFECPIQQNLKILDLTGAGDLFAAGFLHGYINNKSENDCLELGTEMSSKVIQILGARL